MIIIGTKKEVQDFIEEAVCCPENGKVECINDCCKCTAEGYNIKIEFTD